KVQEGMYPLVDDEDDVSPITTVPAVWATERIELLPVHRSATVTTVACREMYRRPVHEPGRHCLPSNEKTRGERDSTRVTDNEPSLRPQLGQHSRSCGHSCCRTAPLQAPERTACRRCRARRSPRDGTLFRAGEPEPRPR